jgi:hypothetical protein
MDLFHSVLSFTINEYKAWTRIEEYSMINFDYSPLVNPHAHAYAAQSKETFLAKRQNQDRVEGESFRRLCRGHQCIKRSNESKEELAGESNVEGCKEKIDGLSDRVEDSIGKE